MRVRPTPPDRTFPSQPIFRRATVVVGASWLAVGVALAALPFDDGWAEDLSVLTRLVTGSVYFVVWMGVPALVVTLATWAAAAWYIDVTIAPKGTFAWLAAVATGLLPGVAIAFEGGEFDAALLIVAAGAQGLAATATRLVIHQAPADDANRVSA